MLGIEADVAAYNRMLAHAEKRMNHESQTDPPVDPPPRFEPVASLPRRLVVVGSVHYQSFAGDETLTASLRFARELGTGDAQGYVRRLRVGPEWQRLDLGWVTEAAAVVVDNPEGSGLSINPTPEEAAEIGARGVLLGVKDGLGNVLPFAVIRPGEQHVHTPPDTRNLYARCLSPDGARVILHAFPA